MAGLALGSFIVSRFIDRSPSPLRVYALLEAGIGLSALCVPFGLEGVRSLYLWAASTFEGHFLTFNLLRAAFALVVL